VPGTGSPCYRVPSAPGGSRPFRVMRRLIDYVLLRAARP